MIAGLRFYPEYKDSGQPWLGQVPAHWSIVRTKRLFRLSVEKSPEQHGMELLSIYTHIGVKPRKELEERGNKATTTDGYWIVKKGDIIVNKLLAWMGAVGVSHYIGVTSPAYDILRPVRSLNSDFYHYLFRTGTYLQQFKSRSRGIMEMRLRLYFDQLGQIPVVLPTEQDQEAIVRFLDAHTRLTSRFIRNRRRLIQLLNEQKQAIIYRAVTRGLDPSVPLKPSGIDWIGDVPEHWRKTLLGAELTLINGYPFDSRRFDLDIGLPLVRIRDIYRSTELRYNGPEVPGAVIDSGDVLVGMDGDFNVAIWRGGRAQLNQRVCCLRPRGALDSEYLAFLIQKPLKWINDQTFSTTVKHLSSHDIRHIRAFIPGIDEQRAIVADIHEETKIFEEAKNRAQREIDLVREYRTRLITDVVTGKVDVRHLAPPPEAIEVEVEPEDLDDEMPGEDEAGLSGEVTDADD